MGVTAADCQLFLILVVCTLSCIRLEPTAPTSSRMCAPTCETHQQDLVCTGNNTAKYLREIAACVAEVRSMIGVVVLKVYDARCSCHWYHFASNIVGQSVHLMTTRTIRDCLKKASTVCRTGSSPGNPMSPEAADYHDIDTASDKLALTSEELGLSDLDKILGDSEDWVSIQKVTVKPVRDSAYDRLKTDDFIYIMIIVAAVMTPVICGLSYLVFYLSRNKKGDVDKSKEKNKKSPKPDDMKEKNKGLLKLFSLKKKKESPEKVKDGGKEKKGTKDNKKEEKNEKKNKKKKNAKSEGKEKNKKEKKNALREKRSRSSIMSELKAKNPGAGNENYVTNVNKLFGGELNNFPSYGQGTFPDVSGNNPPGNAGQNNSNRDNDDKDLMWEGGGGSGVLISQLGTSPLLSDFTDNHTVAPNSEFDTSVLLSETGETEFSPSISSISSYRLNEASTDLSHILSPDAVRTCEAQTKEDKHMDAQRTVPHQIIQPLKPTKLIYTKNIPGINKDVLSFGHVLLSTENASDLSNSGQHFTLPSGTDEEESISLIKTGDCDTSHLGTGLCDSGCKIPGQLANQHHADNKKELCSHLCVERMSTCKGRESGLRTNCEKGYNSVNENRNDTALREDRSVVSISGEEIKSFFYNNEAKFKQGTSGLQVTQSRGLHCDENSSAADSKSVGDREMDSNPHSNTLLYLTAGLNGDNEDFDEYSSLLHYSAAD